MHLIVKAYTAGGSIADKTAVKYGSSDGTVVAATAATDLIVGIVDCPGGAVSGQRVDVVEAGVTEARYGGDVTRGALLTAGTGGKLVAAAPSTGANANIIARARLSGADGDIVPVLIVPGRIQG